MAEYQPTEAQELANAAYVWRQHVQRDLVEALRDPTIDLDRAEFWFTRFTNAYRREVETAKALIPPAKQKGSA